MANMSSWVQPGLACAGRVGLTCCGMVGADACGTGGRCGTGAGARRCARANLESYGGRSSVPLPQERTAPAPRRRAMTPPVATARARGVVMRWATTSARPRGCWSALASTFSKREVPATTTALPLPCLPAALPACPAYHAALPPCQPRPARPCVASPSVQPGAVPSPPARLPPHPDVRSGSSPHTLRCGYTWCETAGHACELGARRVECWGGAAPEAATTTGRLVLGRGGGEVCQVAFRVRPSEEHDGTILVRGGGWELRCAPPL